jgi:hypothetical protein
VGNQTGKRGRQVRRVTQSELAELDRLRELARQRDELRDDIRDRLLAGAEVEPGPWTAKVREWRQKTLSWPVLAAAVGSAAEARIRELIEPKDMTSLVVTRTKYDLNVHPDSTPRRTAWSAEEFEESIDGGE